MPCIRFLIALCAALTLSPLAHASGGVEYRFRLSTPGPEGGDEAGRVIASEQDGRLEWTDAVSAPHLEHPVELWMAGKRLALKPSDGTYYAPNRLGARDSNAPPPSTVPALQVPIVIPGATVRVDEVQVDRTVGDIETVAGLPCRRHSIDLSYRITIRLGRENMVATVDARADFWMTDRLGTLPFHHGSPELVTGFDGVDEAIADQLGTLSGVCLRHTVTAARTFENSPPVQETRNFEIESIASRDADADLLSLPSYYRYEEPVITRARMIHP